MAGGQLGALVSLTQGLDISPLRNAQQFGLQQQELQAQIASSLKGQGLEQQRIDLAREQGIAGRDLERDLAQLQLTGRTDLQELIGTQEVAQLNLKSELDLDLQQSRQDFNIKQAEILATATKDEFDRAFESNNADADRRFALLEQAGDRQKLQAERSLEIDKLKLAVEQSKVAELPTPEQIENQRRLEDRIIELKTQEVEDELGRTPEEKRLRKQRRDELKQLDLEEKRADVLLKQEEVRSAILEKRILTSKITEAGGTIERDDDGNITDIIFPTPEEKEIREEETAEARARRKTAKEKEEASRGVGGLTEEEQGQLAVDEALVEEETFGVSDTLDARVSGFNRIDDLTEANDENSKRIKKAWRRFLKATRKPGAKDLGISFTDFTISPFQSFEGLTTREIKEINKSMQALADLGEGGRVD